jgi:hypothetical protein
VWPGSHLFEKAANGISAELVEERRKVVPPVQIKVPKGGVAFRELRVWHRCGTRHDIQLLMRLALA